MYSSVIYVKKRRIRIRRILRSNPINFVSLRLPNSIKKFVLLLFVKEKSTIRLTLICKPSALFVKAGNFVTVMGSIRVKENVFSPIATNLSYVWRT